MLTQTHLALMASGSVKFNTVLNLILIMKTIWGEQKCSGCNSPYDKLDRFQSGAAERVDM